MFATIKAEFRKLFTVRSTYFTLLFAFLLVGFVSFYAMGYKSAPRIGADGIQSAVFNVIPVMQVFLGIIAILLIAHEYRYNTIMHTLTASNSRLKVMLAKMIVMSGLATVVTLVSIAYIAGLLVLGVHMSGHQMASQVIDVPAVLWKTLVFTITGTLAGLVIGFLARSVVVATTIYFLIPSMIEPILNSLLKVSSNYLPFMVQSQILNSGPPKAFSPVASAGMFVAYLLAAWVIASVLFVRRDAN